MTKSNTAWNPRQYDIQHRMDVLQKRFCKHLLMVMIMATIFVVFLSLCFTCVGTASPKYEQNQPGIVVKKSLLQTEDEEYDDSDSDDYEDYAHTSPRATSLGVYENSSKRIPTALIIGVKKGGTRALLEFLRIHPDVRATGPEIHFFDKRYDMGLDWYRQKMPPTLPGQITMEKTPSYFITKNAPERIYKMSKFTKLIIVVRDPVTRAISDYTQASTKRPGIKTFEELAFLNPETGLVDTSWGAIKIGVYARHLARWLDYFPLSQIHLVSGEELIANPAKVMEDVQDFLGLKRIITDKHFYFNRTKGFPCLKKKGGNGAPHCLGKTKGRAHPIVDEKALQRLRDFYRPFNAKFYRMVGRDFGWP